MVNLIVGPTCALCTAVKAGVSGDPERSPEWGQ